MDGWMSYEDEDDMRIRSSKLNLLLLPPSKLISSFFKPKPNPNNRRPRPRPRRTRIHLKGMESRGDKETEERESGMRTL